MSDMGDGSSIRQTPRKDQAIAAFDFDGTLTVADSFTAFLRWRAGTGGYARGLMKMVPDLIRYLADRDRGRLKAAAVRIFLKGVSRDELTREAEAFADQHWARFMRPDALECWDAWGSKGAWRVIVTASPALTVAPFARRLGAQDLIGTELAFDAADRLAGAFASPNCRAAEKVRRLRDAYGDDVCITAAYGDTSGDAQMLEIAAEQGFRRFRRRPPARQG